MLIILGGGSVAWCAPFLC